MKSLVSYFASRHLLVNVIFFGVIILSIFAWRNIGKEEMPEFESNWVRISTYYPGAAAEDVELFVTKEIEDELKSVLGLESVVATSSLGKSSIRIVIDDDYPDKKEVFQNIKDAVNRVNLPSEVREIPRIRQFKSSEKAILDIGLFIKGQKFLDQKGREKLQQFALTFENQITALKEISSIDMSYYLKPELQVLVDPVISNEKDVSLSLIRNQLRQNHFRVPIGSMTNKNESRVSFIREYENVDDFSNFVIRGNYEGESVKLGEIGEVKKSFSKSNVIFKVNGHEGLFLNVKKSLSFDILTAQESVMKFIEDFKKNNEDAGLGIVLMDDESYEVRNRLSIVSSNAILGFFLIVLVLFLFMDIKSSFWVAMGIPFCAALTLIIAGLLGNTINNMTLAGIIIVLGIVVDDAIIIAENVARHREEGMPLVKASVVGSQEVFKPIFASIVTTCAAFIPLLFFEGFFGKLVTYIPLIVILMLGASLFESLYLLPSHLATKKSFLDRFTPQEGKKNWFHKYEVRYERILTKILNFRIPVLVIFLAVLLGAGYIFKTKMRFVMFPREESKEVIIKLKAKKGTPRIETAKIIQPIEEYLANDKKNVVGVRGTVGQSRRGGEVKENEATLLIEVVPADERDKPLNQIMKTWKKKVKSTEGVVFSKFLKGRWGHGSGSPIEIQVQENNDEKRSLLTKRIVSALEGMKSIKDVDVEKPLLKKEYIFSTKQDMLIKFNVRPTEIAAALRSFVEGSILYSINKGDEEVDVRLSVADKFKDDIKNIKSIRVENSSGKMVPLTKLVDIKKVTKPVSIVRSDYKRSVMIYADFEDGVKITPLEIAEDLEENFFPKFYKDFPTSVISFKGEIEDSRESQGEFLNSILIVLVSIYLILVIMFNSVAKPFIILMIVPFGLAGVVYTLFLHSMSIYGFFAAVGALGMIGVVINDAIVMIDKIETIKESANTSIKAVIAKVASTRLRPIILTTLTTVIGVLPTAYGVAGYDSILSEMMLTMGWGLVFGTFITLVLIPILYSFFVKEKSSV